MPPVLKRRHPAMTALARDPHRLGDVRHGLALDDDTLHEQSSAMERETGVTVSHEDLRFVKTAISTMPGGKAGIGGAGEAEVAHPPGGDGQGHRATTRSRTTAAPPAGMPSRTSRRGGSSRRPTKIARDSHVGDSWAMPVRAAPSSRSTRNTNASDHTAVRGASGSRWR